MLSFSLSKALFYLVLYSFLGWLAEVALVSATQKRFSNRGFLSLPLKVSFGVTAVILFSTLPTLDGNIPMQMMLCITVTEVIRRFSLLLSRGVGDVRFMRELVGRKRIAIRLLMLVLLASIYLLLYLIVHPVIHGLVTLIPQIVLEITATICSVLIVLDFICVRYALYTTHTRQVKESTNRLADRMAGSIWRRLERAYPGADKPSDLMDNSHVFAKGLCFDKLVWVFLISSFLGALIETAYCWATGGGLINRSSVLYGPFSFVWGFGAVVLTVSLRRFSGREDRYTFLAGFVIGGAYEYMCSVFTELVFGTVFWDYSHMTLSIGGRTNVVYCVFWGILAVVWVKILYPLMERGIEKIPPLAGKLLTWAIIIVMGCNGLLTAAAMMRYTERKTETKEPDVIRRMLDTRYDDAFMENRWPYMVITNANE